MSEIENKMPSTRLLEGRVALVTGASRGIGAATARLLALHGAAVVVNYLSSTSQAQQIVSEIESEGGRALAVKADVREQQQVEEMELRIREELGSVDILVLSASATERIIPIPLLEQSWQPIEELWQNQMKALFYPSKVFVPLMMERKKGAVIAISSNWSRSAFERFGALSIAKAGLDAFVRSLAIEVGPHGVRVNAVAPSLVETEANLHRMPQQLREGTAARTPLLHKNATPEDIARVIVLLASDEAAFITGAYLPVNGGSFML